MLREVALWPTTTSQGARGRHWVSVWESAGTKSLIVQHFKSLMSLAY